jgi:hypothetical protein
MRHAYLVVYDEAATLPNLTQAQWEELSSPNWRRSFSPAPCAPPDSYARVKARAPDLGHKFPLFIIWLLIGMVLGYVLRDVVTIQQSRAVESARWR